MNIEPHTHEVTFTEGQEDTSYNWYWHRPKVTYGDTVVHVGPRTTGRWPFRRRVRTVHPDAAAIRAAIAEAIRLHDEGTLAVATEQERTDAERARVRAVLDEANDTLLIRTPPTLVAPATKTRPALRVGGTKTTKVAWATDLLRGANAPVKAGETDVPVGRTTA